MDSSLVAGENLVRKGSGEFVVCPNGLETLGVERGISFADSEVILVFWEVGKLLRKA